jgi:hypothetical protein
MSRVKNTITKRFASARITIVAIPGGFQVIVFIFSQWRHYDKDDRINGGQRQDMVKSYSRG